MSARYFWMFLTGITAVVLLILNAFMETAGERYAVLGACGLAVVHAASGFYMARWAMDKPMKLFLSVVMGGMGLRLMIVGIAVVLMIQVLSLDVKLFIITFGICYLFFQIVEVYFVNRGMQLKKINPTV